MAKEPERPQSAPPELNIDSSVPLIPVLQIPVRIPKHRRTIWSWSRLRRRLIAYWFLFSVLCEIPTVNAMELEETVNDRMCWLENCKHDYITAFEMRKIIDGPNVPYCNNLKTYIECLSDTSDGCRGILLFHTDANIADLYFKSNKCSQVLANPSKACLYSYPDKHASHHNYRYCSTFGSTHMITFDGQSETCSNEGAWLLLDNANVAVMVTNKPVVSGDQLSKVTVISEVIVIVRPHYGCTEQKTYRASLDGLPVVFSDGTGRFNNHERLKLDDPPVEIRFYDHSDSDVVELSLRYISTTIIVRRYPVNHVYQVQMDHYGIRSKKTRRKVSHQLSVSIRIPQKVLATWNAPADTIQLCDTGCLAPQRLALDEVIAAPEVSLYGVLDIPQKLIISKSEALISCRALNLVDFFLDSCVYDLLLSGNRGNAAGSVLGQHDIRLLYPAYSKYYEKNRTNLDAVITKQAFAKYNQKNSQLDALLSGTRKQVQNSVTSGSSKVLTFWSLLCWNVVMNLKYFYFFG